VKGGSQGRVGRRGIGRVDVRDHRLRVVRGNIDREQFAGQRRVPRLAAVAGERIAVEQQRSQVRLSGYSLPHRVDGVVAKVQRREGRQGRQAGDGSIVQVAVLERKALEVRQAGKGREVGQVAGVR